MSRICLPVEGYDRGGFISPVEFANLCEHETRMKQWLRENLPGRTTMVEVKVASVFPDEIDTARYNWGLCVWFLDDSHRQDAVWFKLIWGGTVLKRD